MTDSQMEALTRRLDRIERGLRRWRALGVIAWALLAVSVALVCLVVFRVPLETESSDEPDTEDVVEDEVRARAFVLVDDEGRPRAALAMRPDGTPALAITSADGHIVWKAP